MKKENGVNLFLYILYTLIYKYLSNKVTSIITY